MTSREDSAKSSRARGRRAIVESKETAAQSGQPSIPWAAYVRTTRITTGLILLYYVFVHLSNHALGNISLEVMEAAQPWTVEFFRRDAGTFILGGAALTHFSLALWAVYLKRRFTMPVWEAAQIVLGFTIPLLLIEHVVAARIAREFYGAESGYAYVIWGMRDDPWIYVKQSALLIVAWSHACMGVHYWLRFRSWYPIFARPFFVVVLTLPLLALNGFLQAVREVERLDADPRWHRAFMANQATLGDDGADRLMRLELELFAIFGAILVGLYALRVTRRVVERRHGIIEIVFPGGEVASVTPGPTVLEISRSAGIPHASVCGGRARCSTCRVRVGHGAEHLPPPASNEVRVLNRINASPNVRLACQIRPTDDLEVTPLFPVPPDMHEVRSPTDYSHGKEMEIAVVFTDLRGFTSSSEHQLPYDTVFLLNRYFKEMSHAIHSADGIVDKFMGDGIMALFGLKHDPVSATTNALRAARDMSQRLEKLNIELQHDLPEPLKIGIGIHTGVAIVGEMGWGSARSLTAIGDTVNTASRIEGLTKEYNCELLISSEVARMIGTDLSGYDRFQVNVRGKSTQIEVIAMPWARDLDIADRTS